MYLMRIIKIFTQTIQYSAERVQVEDMLFNYYLYMYTERKKYLD